MVTLLDHSTPNEKVVMEIILRRLYYFIRSRTTILERNRGANSDIDNLISDPTTWLVWLECESWVVLF
jgi:hypothetical protein